MPDENHVNATFYHYKLIKKIPVSRLLVRLYLLLPYIAVDFIHDRHFLDQLLLFCSRRTGYALDSLCYLPIGSAVIRNTVS